MKKILFILFCFCCLSLQAQTIKSNSIIQSGTTLNNTTIGAAEGLQLTGEATQWDDLFFPFTTGTNGGNPYPVFSDTSMAWNFVVDTVGVTKCIQFFCIQFPHSTVFDTIHPHIHYKHTTGQGVPTFVMKYKWVNIQASTTTAFTWERLGTSIDGTTNYTHQIVTNTGNLGILATGKTFSSILVCQIYLLSTTGATKTCDAYQFDIHYKKKSLGTKTEYAD